MGNYRLYLAEYRLKITLFIFAFPVALIIFAFSSCDLRRRGDKHACRDGSAERCLAVGQFYESRSDGFVSTMLSNPTTAINYYQRACKLGNLAGCARFGHMKVVGSYNTIKDDDFTRDDGVSALGKACDGGDLGACHELGDALDPAQAAPVLEKLCKGGDKASCDKLVTAVAASDPKAAVELSVQQCEAGNEAQCADVGGALLIGSDDDRARGIGVLAKACDRGMWARCTQLGQAYFDGTLRADAARSGELFAKACEHDDPDACFESAKSVVGSDPTKSVQLFTANCDKGDLRGCDALGDMWRVGTDATPRTRERAHSIYDRACRAGNDFDCYKRDCMDSPDNASDACGKVYRMQKQWVYKLGGRFDMR